MYFLATHEDVQDKVYKEIKKVLGGNDVEPSSLKDLVWVNSVMPYCNILWKSYTKNDIFYCYCILLLSNF